MKWIIGIVLLFIFLVIYSVRVEQLQQQERVINYLLEPWCILGKIIEVILIATYFLGFLAFLGFYWIIQRCISSGISLYISLIDLIPFFRRRKSHSSSPS